MLVHLFFSFLLQPSFFVLRGRIETLSERGWSLFHLFLASMDCLSRHCAGDLVILRNVSHLRALLPTSSKPQVLKYPLQSLEILIHVCLT